MEFINENYINSLLQSDELLNENYQRDIIAKGFDAKGLSLKESATLLNINSPEILDELFQTAKSVKEKIYGNRLVLFAPLYVTNLCVNNCLYCAFRKDNKELQRKTLTLDEIEEEARYLVLTGQKRILLVAGEHPKKSNVEFIGEAIDRIYSINFNGNNIRRLNVNTAPLSVEQFKELNSYGIGTYQCFQETYHYNTYEQMHSDGPKKNYSWRLYAMDRALQAGIEDVGIGALFGLTDYKFETLALLMHAFDLDHKYGIGPHTISIPRLEPALNAPVALNPPHVVDDLSFKKLIAVIRLAVPYTGIILSTRERAELRRELFEAGVSQISAGSRTSPGAYKESQQSLDEHALEQFQLGDHRSLDEVVKDITSLGYMPSFCTACYRSKRTGDRFMELAKSGKIGKICVPNAIATFEEYLNDFASDGTKEIGKKFLFDELDKINGVTKKKTTEMIERVDKGERDIYL
ncbi:MAG: [FeFe] hydrogenase H-cluster radical SAM maturase HydG [Ignavibacteriaceae bacterium]|nr:[FeFe] hydrogenase H-cluster radical SAM maturase HydG [Ignavibacteria bacterium]NNJ52739.1 [FeFe] hydrogenase H-cluster radical SAM maturase HydG [Ignavibacteriaceae bacterium]